MPTPNLFCEHLALYSAIWMTSGMTRSGSVYALPTSAPRIPGSESSSSPGLALLPSPQANQATAGPDYQRWDREGSGGEDLTTTVHRLLTGALLPTPTARDWKGPNQRRDATCLTGALLPTPRPADGVSGTPNQRGSKGDLMLAPAVLPLMTGHPPTVVDQDDLSDGAADRPGVEAIAPTLIPPSSAPTAEIPSTGTTPAVSAPGSARDGASTQTLAGQMPLLPTPLASDAGPRGGTTGYGLRDWTRALLPTPQARDGDGRGASHPDRRKELDLRRAGQLDEVAMTLLPTPTVMDSHSSGGNSPINVTLTDAAVRTRMGTQPNPRHELLPTPTAADGDRTSQTYPRGNPTLLGAVPMPLLPTPNAADAGGVHMTRSGDRAEEMLLPGLARSLGESTSPPSDAGPAS